MATPLVDDDDNWVQALGAADVGAIITASPPKPRRARLPSFAMQYTSALDKTRGPLRTTSDGNLIAEDTGDWLLLDTPPHDAEDRVDLAAKANTARRRSSANGPVIGMPEAKNGATGLDDPRRRKPVARVLRNRITGSDRLPPPGLGKEENGVPSLEELREVIRERRRDMDERVEKSVLRGIARHLGPVVEREFGEGWAERARGDRGVFRRVLDWTLAVEIREEVLERADGVVGKEAGEVEE
ncbi:hypothetical protein BU26DRAFT_466178 [Trematosphaeria pertusa]|uniref:Uncharacterized protein n=1 Tax=Trematosphaeria pertusa TaxID=390896 RepID=A0A6A6HZK4_9PLEO|nr:uncharacterized protein BU26DRAFT_466178 [Trematosphaeria pertusa]KAF2243501.1 hypothetical protein BU26DRAFT_466178 [Trematosphaeria pertusa]